MSRLVTLLLVSATALIAAPGAAGAHVVKRWPTKPSPRRQPPNQGFAKPPPPRNVCLRQRRGAVVYLEQTRYRRYRGPRPRPRIAPHPQRMPRRRRVLPNRSGVTIYANGAWTRYQYGRLRQGCLRPRAMRRLRRLLRVAQFRRDPRQLPVCTAIPTMVTTISAGRHSFTFRHPCGLRVHPSLIRVRNFVRARTR